MSSLRREAIAMIMGAALSVLVLAGALGALVASAIIGDPTNGYWAARLVPILLYFFVMLATGWAGWHMANEREFTRVIPRLLSVIGALLVLAGLFETFGGCGSRRLNAQPALSGGGDFGEHRGKPGGV